MSRAFAFPRGELRPAERQLRLDGDAVALGARALDVLVALVERRDRVVSKRELFELAWPGLVVEENNLQVQVSALRKVLGAQAIATVPGRGYRFTLPVTEADSAGAALEPHAPPAMPDRPRDNVPPPLGALHGRDADRAAVERLLDDARIVSIVGAGGIGKTRLVLAVAHEQRAARRDGTWVVDLAPVSAPAMVVAEVARVLGVPQASLTPHTLAAALAGQSMLLVLDNCEHVLDAVAPVCDALVRAAPGVRMLVTSVEPLKVEGERVHRLDGLPVPGDDADGDTAGAAALFVERAQAVDPGFRLDAASRPAVAEICRRLDGIPLALELAAARVPLLGVEGVRARLDERFRVLSAGSRLVLRRHQTLRAALDFSHGLLDEAERVVLRRVGVFAATFTVEAAQRLCADERLDEWEALRCLGTLVDKSLLVAKGDKPRRLRLLETTRAYALERLADAHETDALLARHAEVTAATIARAHPEAWTMPHDEWLARYEPELDDVRAAIAWSLDHRPALAIRLVGDTLRLWQELALQPEALRACEAARARLADDTPPRDAGRLWYAEAMMCANTDTERSHDAAARAVALLREAGDRDGLALALTRLANWSFHEATPEQWRALEELDRLQAPGMGRHLDMLRAVARAILLLRASRPAEARRHFERARDLAQAVGHPVMALRNQQNVAASAFLMGDVREAIAIQRETAPRLAASRDRLFHVFSTLMLATGLLMEGENDAAAAVFVPIVPRLLGYGLGLRYASTTALFAAAHGRLAAAARLLGYGDGARPRHADLTAEPIEALARARAFETLATLDDARRRAWLAEGVGADLAELYAAAIGDGP